MITTKFIKPSFFYLKLVILFLFKQALRTTQLAFQFYEKMGFELDKTKKDFWAKGFDLYQMKMKN